MAWVFASSCGVGAGVGKGRGCRLWDRWWREVMVGRFADSGGVWQVCVRMVAITVSIVRYCRYVTGVLSLSIGCGCTVVMCSV